MKRKYFTFVYLIVFIILFISMMCYGIYFANNMAGSVNIPNYEALPDIKIPDKNIMAYIDYMEQHIEELAYLKGKNKVVNLKLLGYRTIDKRQIEKKKNKTIELENGFSYTLTLAFFSEYHRFCVIDGQLYPEKAILPDGGKIEKIKDNKVLILKNNKKIWIHIVSSPVHSVKYGKDKPDMHKNIFPTRKKSMEKSVKEKIIKETPVKAKE